MTTNHSAPARLVRQCIALTVTGLVGLTGLSAVSMLRPSPAVAQSATPISTPLPPERTITISGRAAVRVVPDRATITLGVVTRNDSVVVAHDTNQGTVRAVTAALRKAGVPSSGISPGLFTIDETQVDSSSERNSYVKTTYGVTTQVTVTLTDLTKIGGALRAAVDAGANRVDVSFGTTKLRQARDQARAAAIKAAREKGRDMAIAAGIELGRVRSFSEQSPWWGSAATQNSVQNLDRRVAANIEAGGSVDDSLLFGEGPIVVDAEVTLEIAVK